jgi:hypothetical protein
LWQEEGIVLRLRLEGRGVVCIYILKASVVREKEIWFAAEEHIWR